MYSSMVEKSGSICLVKNGPEVEPEIILTIGQPVLSALGPVGVWTSAIKYEGRKVR